MKTSYKGINLIKEFEGFRGSAYKADPFEKYYTIGYGHYGADVNASDRMTMLEAEKLLEKDLPDYEAYVNKYDKYYHFNQNEFDALVSFTYNCGGGNLGKLLNYGNRTRQEIRKKILEYNKAGGKELAGLTRRRKAELSLFNATMKVMYFPQCNNNHVSIVQALKQINAKSDYEYRKLIGKVNGFPNYQGSASQNIALLSLLKEGKLIKP